MQDYFGFEIFQFIGFKDMGKHVDISYTGDFYGKGLFM
jgi:hypothetical protein